MSDRPLNVDDSDSARGGWRLLVTVPSREEAALISGLLTSEGLESQLESLFFTQEPVNFGLLGSVRVWVPERELVRAQQVLAADPAPIDTDSQDDASGEVEREEDAGDLRGRDR